jgi:hypothetical protein
MSEKTKDISTNGDSPTFDVEEFKRRVKAAREALLEAENFLTTWEEAEKRKKAATPPDIQK